MDAGLTELLGYAAAGLVLATFSARSITTLRALAIASNLLFIAYAACAALLPVLLLHALLLPLNAWRLQQALAEKQWRPTPADDHTSGAERPSVASPRGTADRASMRCRYGALCGRVRAGRRMPRVQRQNIEA